MGRSTDLEFSEEERKVLAMRVVGVFKSWKLATHEQSMILGLSVNGRSTINRYANGHPVAQNHDLLWRIGNILAIFRLLRSYDINRPDRADKWMTTQNPYTNGARPIDLMKNPDGVAAVRAWLEAYGDGSMATDPGFVALRSDPDSEWLQANKGAIEEYKRFVEENGCFGDKLRKF